MDNVAVFLPRPCRDHRAPILFQPPKKNTRIQSSNTGPSQRFIIIASLVIAIMAIMSLNSWLSFPEEFRQTRQDFIDTSSKKE